MNLSALFPLPVSLPGAMSKDPRFMPIFDATIDCSLYNGSTKRNPTGPFFTEIARGGAALSTATAGVYGTICDLTGRGVLFHVIPALMNAMTDTVSFRITVDGVAREIVRAGSWAGNAADGRVVLGHCDVSAGARFTSANAALYYYVNTVSLSDRLRSAATDGVATLTPRDILFEFGGPMVFFEESLKVETKVSALGAGTNAQYSAASYMLLG